VASFEFCLGTLQVALLETCKSAQEHQRLLPVALCSSAAAQVVPT